MQLISPAHVFPSSPRRCLPFKIAIRTSESQKRHTESFSRGEEGNAYTQNSEGNRSRRGIVMLPLVSSGLLVALSASGKVKSQSPYDERRLLEQNKKMQEANNAPENFPNFIREGFQVKVVTSENYVKRDSGLIYLDLEVGKGDCPKDGQQVTFHYVGFNESGRRIDSTYLQGSPAKVRLGNKALVPGFEEGIRDMRPGGKRRIIIPPELGPPDNSVRTVNGSRPDQMPHCNHKHRTNTATSSRFYTQLLLKSSPNISLRLSITPSL